jgi:transposase InsO family protein
MKAMEIRHRPISPGSPWQNGIVERLIGRLRRECLDHIIVIGECHLRCVLFAYATYYNQARPHRSLQKDAPLWRAIRRIGEVAAISILGGLHHQYVRI